MTPDSTNDRSRKRGAITTADRKFLRNPDEYSRQGRHAREEAIVERVRNTLLDFTILFEELPDELRHEIFQPDDGEELEGITDGARHAIALLYLEAYTTNFPAPFKVLLRSGIMRAWQRMLGTTGIHLDMDFDVEVERDPTVVLEEAEEKIKAREWEDISHGEMEAFLKYYAESDEFDPSTPRREFLKEAKSVMGDNYPGDDE